MPYYVRAFCKSEGVPAINELERALKFKYPEIRIETEDDRVGKWENAEYYYKIKNHILETFKL